MAFQSHIDKKFMGDLPTHVQQSIYIDFIFKDFLYRYKRLFTLRYKNRQLSFHDEIYCKFIVSFCKNLEPR